MKLSIIIIGDEILIGQVTDTNSGFISRSLGSMGWTTQRVMTVGDNAEDIRAAINLCIADCDLVITTGGLGPTKDDITKALLCELFGGPMVFDDTVAENIREVFDKRGLKLNPLTEGQAWVPASCRVIQNRLGTAPIMWFEVEGGKKVLIAMPGVPFETEGMMDKAVRHEIDKRFCPNSFTVHRSLMITGITESCLAQELEKFEESLPANIHLAYLPTPGLIRLRLDVNSDTEKSAIQLLNDAYERLCREANDYIIYRGDATAAEIAIDAVRRHGYHIASAESCTGGNIAHAITKVSGCSDVYFGSVVSYDNSIKTNVLGVDRRLIEKYGAVSREVVAAMAEGVARLMNVECAVATSGIAGPGGGSNEKPVGTVWTAVVTPHGTDTFVKRYPGNRTRVIDRATTEALLALAKRLK